MFISRHRRRSLAAGGVAGCALLAWDGWRIRIRTGSLALAASGSGEWEDELDVVRAEADVLERLNAGRAAAAQPALSADPRLMALARWRSEDMARTQAFSHDVGGRDVFQIMRERRLPFVRANENLAFNNLDAYHTVERAMAELMASPEHRAAMLDPGFDCVGVGVARGRQRRTYFTQLLVQSAPAPSAGPDQAEAP
jgi:uncharacterized protein YkwD